MVYGFNDPFWSTSVVKLCASMNYVHLSQTQSKVISFMLKGLSSEYINIIVMAGAKVYQTVVFYWKDYKSMCVIEQLKSMGVKSKYTLDMVE